MAILCVNCEYDYGIIYHKEMDALARNTNSFRWPGARVEAPCLDICVWCIRQVLVKSS
jgi:hypothetical protein